jgi:hypothetical protein
MKKQFAKFMLFNSSECFVDDGKHQIHKKVQGDDQIGDEKDGGYARSSIRRHHHIGKTVTRNELISSRMIESNWNRDSYLAVVNKTNNDTKLRSKVAKCGSNELSENK